MKQIARLFGRSAAPAALRAAWRKLRYAKTLQQPLPEQILPGGLAQVEKYFDRRESPYRHARKVIPDIQLDLQALKERQLPGPEQTPRRGHTTDARKKYRDLRTEFGGRSELLALHALVCALLRRRGCHPRYRRLFLRMWREEGEFLASNLSTRWLISAATSFADIGATAEQRVAGQSFALVFDLIKLHDSERRLSGRPNAVPFRLNAPGNRDPLAFDLMPYSFEYGDLDFSILSRLIKLAKSDPLIEPLGNQLLSKLITDHRTVFARAQKLKHPRVKPARAQRAN